MMKKFVIFIAAAVCFTLFVGLLNGCSRKNEIKFDDREPESLTPGYEWVVVSEPYVAFRDNAGFENVVSGEGRRGEIYEVLGKDIVSNGRGSPTPTTVWYKIEKGWIDENGIYVFDNKMKANSAARKLMEK